LREIDTSRGCTGRTGLVRLDCNRLSPLIMVSWWISQAAKFWWDILSLFSITS
jgi:hypothetical protein